MKFKTIFFLFNAIIVLSLGFILILPVMLLDWEYTRLFWSANWYLAALFAALLAGVNWYFLRFWGVYQLLEREDWQSLQRHLHSELFDRNRTRYQYIRLYINTAIVRSQPAEILTLEQHLNQVSPRMHRRFAQLLGLPYLLQGRHDEMEAYYQSVIGEVSGKSGEWVVWAHAFALFLQKKLVQAKPRLQQLLADSRDPVLRAMTMYMLDACLSSDDDERQQLMQQRDRFVSRHTQQQLLAAAARKADNILVLILDQFIRDAADWLYRNSAAEEHTGDRENL